VELTCQPQKKRGSKEGRHVGLDFYDLLIEVLYRMRPIVEVRRWAPCCGRVRYSGLREAAFVRGGRYGILIDFGLEVIGRESTCGRPSIWSSCLFP
jgi:hypothetical protein